MTYMAYIHIIRTYLKSKMEKADTSFTVSPFAISLKEDQDSFQFSVKNMGYRSCHYEVFVPDCNHFKLLSNRTFSLAPGITKIVKMKHIPTLNCSTVKETIQVVDGFGSRKELEVTCRSEVFESKKRIEIAEQMTVSEMKVNEEKKVELRIKNSSASNLQIKVRQMGDSNTVQIKMEEDSFILLKDAVKNITLSIKMLTETESEVVIQVDSIEEESKDVESSIVRIVCNSLLRCQFILDENKNKADSTEHDLLNGTSLQGSFYLVNNYHRACTYKIHEVFEVQDYKHYSQRLSELCFKPSTKEGIVEAGTEMSINYNISTTLTQNDLSFTQRYSQLSIKDETNAYKLRSSKYFQKQIEVVLKILFGKDHVVYYRIKNYITNPALRIDKSPSEFIDSYSILNDSGLEVPFTIINNMHFSSKPDKGTLKVGLNSIDISWKAQEGTFKTKQNKNVINNCQVQLNIPQNQILLFDPNILTRPKTALLKDKSRIILRKDALKERISFRAPIGRGEPGVKGLKQVGIGDIMCKANKYIKHEVLDEQQLYLLQVNQNQRGYVLTNAHPSKNIMVNIADKGYLFLQSCYSYVLPFDKKSLHVEHNGMALQIKSKEIDDKQPYKIKNKELLFCFSQGQKQYDVVKEIEVINRSNDIIMMYCLSVEDEYFHSLEPNHKALIEPNSSQIYKISFRPQTEQYNKIGKVTRYLQFMINEQKEIITCQGDLLSAQITTDSKEFIFKNCAYSCGEVIKTFTLNNKGLNKVTYNIENSSKIKISPSFGVISQKGKQNITLSFKPSQMTKQYEELITIELKGSHLIVLPFKVNTLEPQIYCEEQILDFQEGYLTQHLNQKLRIINNNPYNCNLDLHLEETEIIGPSNVLVQAGSTKTVELKLQAKKLGENVFKLPLNIIELKGYGAIKGPKQYRYIGKKTFLQIIPENPTEGLVVSKHQQTNAFIIKNISEKIADLQLVLKKKQPQEYLIISCEPSSVELNPGQERQFRLHSIRADEDKNCDSSKQFTFNLSIFFNHGELYRSIDFPVSMPPPQLQINPQQVFFPLACVGTWSKANFTIVNKGYKQVFLALKKPTNIAFDLQVEFSNNDNRLTKLKNKTEVKLFYKSKKPISFGVVLEIENNFGQKYEVKLNGTASISPLLKCDRIGGSSRAFSSREIKTLSSTGSLKSMTLIDSPSEEHQNFKFFNKWINGLFPDSSRRGQNFHQWLTNPLNFLLWLDYIRSGVWMEHQHEKTLSNILDQLKRLGYPIYTVQEKLLKDGTSCEWAQCMWFILSKSSVKEDCLKWINKICGIRLQTYDNAYNHYKKILIEIISKTFEPIFKGKTQDWQRISDIFESSIPILPYIDNKRQFVLLINLLYNKFSQIQSHQVSATNCIYRLSLPKPETNNPEAFWILGSDSFDVELPENCTHQRYLPEKKLLSFMAEGQTTINLKFKEDTWIAVWTNSFEQPLRMYSIRLDKKTTKTHNITIECEDQCSQEWKLKFPCEVDSEHTFNFYSCNEFKCKMPPLGVTKSGDVLEFTVTYSPKNLKEHQGTLTIINKYQEYIYNIRGKPLRTSSIQREQIVTITQGQICDFTFSIPQNPITSSSNYTVCEYGSKTEQLKNVEAKSNKKDIIICASFQCYRLLRNYQIILQVSNKEQSFNRNIRLVVNVVAKPIIIQAELKGTVNQKTIEKIPVTNLINSKQNCFISFHSLEPHQYLNFSQETLNKQQGHPPQQQQMEFVLSHQGKLSLKPKQSTKIQLSYMPLSGIQSFCQVRLRFEQSEQLIIYNFRGVAEVPSTDNQVMQINCEVEKEVKRGIKVYNKLRQKMRFEVETNLNFIAGPQQVVIQAKQQVLYQFKMRPLHAGDYSGKLVFKNDRVCLVYPLKIKVIDPKAIQTISVKSKIRVSTTISIHLSNKSEKDVEYQVLCERDYLQYPETISIPAKSEKSLVLNYTPLFIGVKTVHLKLYHQLSNQITYILQMESEQRSEDVFISCELGEHKEFKVNFKNPTQIEAQLFEGTLPEGLVYKHGTTFPLSLPPNSTTPLELLFTPSSLKTQWESVLSFETDKIGSYVFNLVLYNENKKIMPETIVKYDYQCEEKSVIKKYIFCQMFNPFNQNLSLKFESKTLKYNKFVDIQVQSQEKIVLAPYQKRMIRSRADIMPYQPESMKLSEKTIEDRALILKSGEFKWVFPIMLTQIRSIPSTIEIIGPSHEFISSRVILKYIKILKNWEVTDFPNFQKQLNVNLLSSNDLHFQAIINKNMDYLGSVIFYQEDMSLAEKYPLSLKIGGNKIKNIPIEANVGQTGTAKIKIKNGRGPFKVTVKNNRKNQFRVDPLEGFFSQTQDNIFTFEYHPIEYNGSKRVEVGIESEGGNFDFCVIGKFPQSKTR